MFLQTIPNFIPFIFPLWRWTVPSSGSFIPAIYLSEETNLRKSRGGGLGRGHKYIEGYFSCSLLSPDTPGFPLCPLVIFYRYSSQAHLRKLLSTTKEQNFVIQQLAANKHRLVLHVRGDARHSNHPKMFVEYKVVILSLSMPGRRTEGLDLWLHSFLISALDGDSDHHHAPAALPPEEERSWLLNRSVSESQSASG